MQYKNLCLAQTHSKLEKNICSQSIYLCSHRRYEHCAYSNIKEEKILVMGGATHDGDAKTGVELPGEYRINLKMLLSLRVLSDIINAHLFSIFIQ